MTLGFRVASWNLRFDSKPDNISVQDSISALPDPLEPFGFLNGSAERPWSTRRLRVAETLLSEGIQIAGFQEALVRQVNDLAELFGDDWSWIGIGRDDGVEAGEFSPIFYKKSAITLLSNDFFWLSNTPFEPSKFPGAGSFRICSAARFTLNDGIAPRNFSLLNTHLDDQSDDQRRLAASLLLTRARFEAVTTGNPVFITGDFNSPSFGDDSGAYDIITGAANPVPINATFAEKFAVGDDEAPDFKMVDLRGKAPRERVSRNYATFTGFTAPADTSSWTRIDFILGGSNAGWNIDSYKVLSALQDDGMLSSDHRPVFADIIIS
ncbi:endonuclease exonuclease phosphatase family protein [Moniliophthora roreri]|uniref:Putative mannose-6-phosphatase n=1 Tax=Moniliophthora roreri TaxID=221103 RepID=A0A0W0EZP6_MONRR|nr:endonuclease exonuclease phosphatase family protein [Moniliophthora roreri]